MTLTLLHHPYSRAANTVWMLEEIGLPYELRWVDMVSGAHKSPDLLALNPMGKLPILLDGPTVVTENAAIALYLGDRHGAGRLAPALDDPRRAPYLRWTAFAPAVIEPGAMAKSSGWSFEPSSAGWGEYEAMLKAIDAAIGKGPFVCGEQFTMADTVLGGTLRYMVRFEMITPSAAVSAYCERLAARPALQRAEAKNQAIAKEHGLG
jgi:glutathione S-transferase